MAADRFLARFLPLVLCATFACLLLLSPATARDKETIWNYDGGVMMQTDGTLPNGICFRINGRVSSGHFFDDLKRIDRVGGDTIFQRGTQTLTQFPDKLLLEFTLFDEPCSTRLQSATSRIYLTRAMVSEFHLYLYWKHGVELRPITGFVPVDFSVHQIAPYNPEATDLPERLQWFYALAIPSASVPLTDSLVMIIRTPDGHTAARFAARL
jgi:hypothetical protein